MRYSGRKLRSSTRRANIRDQRSTPESAHRVAMSEVDERASRKWLGRAAAVAACGIVVYFAVSRFWPFGLFAVAGAAIVLVYVFDVPQLLFSALEGARRRVQGVEHNGRHDWYGFQGNTIRVFFDDRRRPWMAVKEIAHIIQVEDVADAFRHYRPAEFAKQPFAKDEYCLSEAGLRHLLKYSRHRDAHAFLLWFEREVLMPLRRRQEQSSAPAIPK